MKIICTEQEKENLLDSTASSPFCPIGIGFCAKLDAERCAECFVNNVDWEITDADE